MPVDCSQCKTVVCRTGHVDSPPENCPIREGFPAFEELYSTSEARDAAFHAARIEADGYCEWTRIRELAELATRTGAERLGIAYCADMGREAALAAEYLSERSLTAIQAPGSARCDPRGQADFFARQHTQLNVIAGMCVGHEAIFVRASEAPVVALVARDARLRHNPVAALYTSRSYSKKALYGERPEGESTPFRGWDLEVLEQVSRELREDGGDDLNRVQETMDFARRMGASHLGISFCVGFREEAKVLARVLRANGFEVSSVCCKTGAVPKEKLGILEAQKVRPGEPEMICNPLAQAELLNRDGVQLALILGQCVGHDSATMSKLDAPAVCLVAKDRVLAHNTVAALYELERG